MTYTDIPAVGTTPHAISVKTRELLLDSGHYTALNRVVYDDLTARTNIEEVFQLSQHVVA